MSEYVKEGQDAAWEWLTTFRAPRFIDISDLRLGASNRALQVLVLVYFILIMAVSKEYEIKYTPNGSTQYYISAGTMYTDQAADATFCTNAAAGDYDYTDADCASGDLFWCENNIGCYDPLSYEANVKAGDVAWIYTYVKDTKVQRDDCATMTSAACTAISSSASYKDYGGTDNICGCESYENYFLTGVSGMKVTVAHSYTVDDLGKSETNVLTRVRGPGASTTWGELDGDYMEVPAGDNVVLTVADLLAASNIPTLDGRHQYAMDLYPSGVSGEYLIYRMTGLEIHLDFQYVGSVGPDIPGGSNVECILTVSAKEGYASKGNTVSYYEGDYPSATDGNVEFNDRYYRGIKMTLKSGGIVGTFDFFNLIVVMTSVSILLSFSATIVSMVAYTLLGYTSHVYDHFGQQKLKLRRLHAKIAGQALIAGKVWRELVDSSHNSKVGVDELRGVYLKQGYNESDAQELAVALLSSKHDDEDPGVEAIKETFHTMGMMGKIDDSQMSTSQKRRSATNVHKDYALAKVKDDYLDFYSFCDLLSEEQTSLYAAMGRPEDGDDSSHSSNSSAPAAEQAVFDLEA